MAADPRRSRRARIRRARLRSWAPVLVILGALAVAGLVAIPLGGWDTVELQRDRVPELAPGEPFTNARNAIVIEGAEITDDHPDDFTEADPGRSWLLVHASVENLLEFPDLPTGTGGFRMFTIEGVLEADSSDSVDVYLAADGTPGPRLNPQLPMELTYVFDVPSAAFRGGDEVRVQLWDAIRQEADLYRGIRWWQPHVEVEVPVVLEDER